MHDTSKSRLPYAPLTITELPKDDPRVKEALARLAARRGVESKTPAPDANAE